MKKLFVLIAFVVMFPLLSFAQFVGTSSSSKSTQLESGFFSAGVSFSPLKEKWDWRHTDGQGETDIEQETGSLYGFGLSLTYTSQIINKIPLLFEVGGLLQYSYGDNLFKDEEYREKHTYLSFKIPFNVLYALDVPNSHFTLAPYVGLVPQYYLSGDFTSYYSDTDKGDRSSIFEEDWHEDYKGKARRLGIDWQLGVKAILNKYYLGLSYEMPINNLFEGHWNSRVDSSHDEYIINLRQFNISVGYIF